MRIDEYYTGGETSQLLLAVVDAGDDVNFVTLQGKKTTPGFGRIPAIGNHQDAPTASRIPVR